MARLKEIYQNELVPKLKEELQLDNVMEVPRVEKLSSIWVSARQFRMSKFLNPLLRRCPVLPVRRLLLHAPRNRLPVQTAGRDAYWGYGTLRRDRAYEFLDRLINVALPRVRTLKVFLLKLLMAAVITLLVFVSS